MNLGRGLIVLTANEVLKVGLELVHTNERIHKVKGDPWTPKTNHKRFKGHCGTSHVVVSSLWGDLQTTNFVPPDVPPQGECIESPLESLNFIYRYKRETEREAVFDKSRKTLRKWCLHYLKRIQALKSQKIIFPEFNAADVWIMTVDGTHCKVNEPSHPECSMDEKCFSHKHKNSGMSYELGIHLFESKLIWMNGPFPAGRNDNGNFSQGGLKAKLISIQKKALGDKGHNGHPEACSTYNAFDDAAVKKFKSRAQMRHEQFNGMLKEFSCLDNCFRHGEEMFKVCFEATAVICQCRMDHGEQLFDLLSGIWFDNAEGESDEDADSDSD